MKKYDSYCFYNLVRKFLFLLIAIFSLSFHSFAQSKTYNISGFIKDEVSGEVLTGANLLLYKDSITIYPYKALGTNSNIYGFYVFPNLASGRYFIIVRYIGYKSAVREIKKLDENLIHFNIDLKQVEIQKEEVLVIGERQHEMSISNIDIAPELLLKLPSLSGETDLFRLLQMLPGIKTQSELSGGLYVRGGSPDQNLTLVDGITIYNPAHIGNIASTFNSDAIQEIRLIKGAFPAEYGGKLSSILDIKLRAGSKEKSKGNLGVGLINSHFTLEGPLGNKLTYIISGRKMYYDVYQNKFKSRSSVPRYNFNDINSKINYFSGDENVLTFSMMYSKDNLYSSSTLKDFSYSIGWDNLSFGVNWLHINSKSFMLNSGFGFTNYGSKSLILTNSESKVSDNFFTDSRLNDFSFIQKTELHFNSDFILKTGFDITLHQYALLYSTAYDPLIERDPYAGDDLNSLESALYFQIESRLTSRLKTNTGLRFYYFRNRKYFNAEPRFEISYAVTENTFIKSAYMLTHQFLHLISRNDISLPTDLWYPSTKNILPGSSAQYVIALDQFYDEHKYLLSIESYYRNMNNLYEYKNGATFSSVKNSVEKEFIVGKGEAYGVEVFFNKSSGNITGWLGYTLSWTKRKFNELNDGKIFYPKYDRRNDFSFVITYKIDEFWSTGITFTYASGGRYSLPPAQYKLNEISPGDGASLYVEYPELNTAQLPAFHKLDLNITYKFELFGSAFEAYINIYNLYNRQNPFANYAANGLDSNGKTIILLKQLILFPIIPTLGLNFKF